MEIIGFVAVVGVLIFLVMFGRKKKGRPDKDGGMDSMGGDDDVADDGGDADD